MSTGQIRRFANAEADDAAKAALLEALDPTSTLIVDLNIHPACSHHPDLALQRQLQHGVAQSGRALCRT